jgi:hypothetical protein
MLKRTAVAMILTDIQFLRQDIRSQKKQLIAANMQLTDAEAGRFWPVYDAYTPCRCPGEELDLEMGVHG